MSHYDIIGSALVNLKWRWEAPIGSTGLREQVMQREAAIRDPLLMAALISPLSAPPAEKSMARFTVNVCNIILIRKAWQVEIFWFA